MSILYKVGDVYLLKAKVIYNINNNKINVTIHFLGRVFYWAIN